MPEPAIGLDRLADQRQPVRLAGDVDRRGGSIASSRTDISGDRFSLLLEDICDDDPGSLLGKEPRLRLAHPMCCAGDDCDFVLQTHGFSPTAVRELLRSILAANRSSREKE